MPGVLIDDQNYQMDNLSPSSFFEALGSFSPASISHAQQQHQDHHHQQQHHAVHQADHHQQQQQAHHQLMRHHSFSGGTKDASSGAGGGSLSHAAPVYHRSQSALSSAAAFHALNYFNSPPTTPRKSADAAGGFSPLSSLLDVGADDFSSMRAGDGDGSLIGGGLSVSPGANAAVAMAISGSPVSGDLRSLAFSNSAIVGSPTLPDSVAALHKFLPSNNEDEEAWGGSVVDVYACDQFRMFEFKVRRCMRGRSHDWTECPFAHPGEKARRRDPRRFHYSGTACPDFRKGSCRRGDACEFAHGVFECWLHPARYRTQPCKDGRNCRRRVCFFAHTAEQLRLLPAAAAANASPRGSTGSLGGGGGSQGSALSGAGSLSGSYDGSPVRSCSSASSFDGAYAFDGLSHCAVNSHGSCQHAMNYGAGGAATATSAVCGGHFEQAYGGNVGAHCCASPQMSSPTSTLVGHSTSPPPLSPPTSPGGSPPMSPQSPQHWPSSQGLHRNGGAFSSAQASLVQSPGSYGQNLSQTGFSQSPCSPLSRPSNGQSAMSAAVAAAAAHAQQHGQPLTPAHRRHLDRLNSMPALAIPPADHPSHRGMMQSVSSPLSTPSSCSPPSPDGLNSTTNVMMSDLIATIEQLGIRGSAIPLWLQGQAQVQAAAAAAANVYSSGPSPLRRCSQSVPCTPTKQSWEEKSPPAWETVAESEEVEPAVQRVESGRDLRAKIYGRLGKENRQDSGDAPDLGWVSELVKDEQAW